MRRSIIFITSLFFSLSTFAQETNESKTRYYRHEVNVSIGGIRVRSGWSNDYERSVMNQFGLVVGKAGGGSGPGTGIVYQWEDDPDLGNDNALKAVSYYYHFNNRIAVGGLFGGCRVSDWLGYPEAYKPREIQKTGYTDVK